MLIRLLPWLLGGVSVMGAYWYAYDNGYDSASAKCNERIESINQAHDDALEVARKEQAQRERNAVERAKQYWEDNQKQEVVTKTIEKEVIKYVEREANDTNTCEFNADFVRIWNAANTGSIENEPD